MVFKPIYILILGFTIVVDYFAGILLENTIGKKRTLYLIMSLIANIGVLAFFKYYNFLNDNIAAILGSLRIENPIPLLAIVLPIGLSFHTFQAMSYTIEVYRGKHKAERHFGIYALYVMFYPQLVAGPIERPQNLLHQFHDKHTFDYQRVVDGLKLMTWGLFKKVVIADRLAVAVNQIYADPSSYQGIHFLIATFFYAFQIYCDFSGYSSIAIGAAKVMDIKLMMNFNTPYFSKSIHEFWTRWHISLSSWFRDYFYISLGGNRVSKSRWYLNLLLVFMVSGLWHGANWTFVVWGSINGFYLVFSILTKSYRDKVVGVFFRNPDSKVLGALRILTTFGLTCVAWIFFRATSLHDAMYILTHLFSGFGDIVRMKNVGLLGSLFSSFGLEKKEFIYAAVSIVLLLVVDVLNDRIHLIPWLKTKHVVVRWAAYYGLVVLIIAYGAFSTSQQFIYFQF